MSLCDRCIAPGACCMALTLSGRDGPYTVWDDQDANDQLHARSDDLGMFVSAGVHSRWTVPGDAAQDSGRAYSQHIWRCTALDRSTGRCTIYETRPQLCRDYEPASDGLCVYYRPLENGEESIL